MRRFVGLCCLVAGVAQAAPTELQHQGRLVDASGEPIHGTVDLTVSLYDDAEATNEAVWSTGLTDVAVEQGYFSVIIDPPDSALAEEALYVGISVAGVGDLTPRSRLSAVPYARNVTGGAVEASSLSVGGEAITSADVAAWRASSPAPVEILGLLDPRVTLNGAWSASTGWGHNRLTSDAAFTDCASGDCSAASITLSLPDNRHRAVSMSQLDWSDSGRVDVYLSVGGGPEVLLRQFSSYAPGVGSAYYSVMHTIASDLPLGEDVSLRVVAADGRMHVEGFALADLPLPITRAPQSSYSVPDNNLSGNEVLDQRIAFTLERDAVLQFSYNMSGESNNNHVLCGFLLTRPDRTEFPTEGRSITGATTYASVSGQMVRALTPGNYTIDIRCRRGAAATFYPAVNDWHDRHTTITWLQ